MPFTVNFMLNFNIMGALTNFHHLQKGQFLCKSLKFVNETNKSAIFYQTFLQNYLVLRVYLLLLWMVHKVVGFVLKKKKQNDTFVKIYKACYLGKLDQSFYAHFLSNDLFLGMIRYKDQTQ